LFMRFLCLLTLLCSAPTLAATVPVQKEFRDWVVTCDNLRSCVAEGADQANPSLIVRFSREAGPHGQDRELVCVEHGVSEQVTVGVSLDAVVSERDSDLAHRGP